MYLRRKPFISLRCLENPYIIYLLTVANPRFIITSPSSSAVIMTIENLFRIVQFAVPNSFGNPLTNNLLYSSHLGEKKAKCLNPGLATCSLEKNRQIKCFPTFLLQVNSIHIIQEKLSSENIGLTMCFAFQL